jgi:hypothetical protein
MQKIILINLSKNVDIVVIELVAVRRQNARSRILY